MDGSLQFILKGEETRGKGCQSTHESKQLFPHLDDFVETWEKLTQKNGHIFLLGGSNRSLELGWEIPWYIIGNLIFPVIVGHGRTTRGTDTLFRSFRNQCRQDSLI